MPQQTINIGSAANDGTGDTLRNAFDKTNDNFNELYAREEFTSADHSKLDGIEDNATADQTGAEIVSAIDTELGQTDWKTGGGGGGSVPVQDDGVQVVATPTAINFTGAGVTVTDVSGVASVAIPGGGGASYPSFTGNAGKVLAVNTGETDVEWVEQSGGGSAAVTVSEVSITNGDFETGDTTGWTVTTGTAAFSADPFTSGSWDSVATTARNGTYILYGGTLALFEMYQDVDVSADTNILYYEMTADCLKNFADNDITEIILSALDGNASPDGEVG